MACLVFRKGAKCWYARYRHGGREYLKSLGIAIADRDRYEEGEETRAYLKSRAEAERALEVLLNGLDSSASTEQVLHAVYQARSRGRKVKVYPVDRLSDTWKNIRRSRKPSEKYVRQCVGWINSFSTFMRKHYSHALTMDHLGEEHAEEYMLHLEERGLSPKTYNDILKTLRAVTKRARNPIFDYIPLKKSETISRVPYEPDELLSILDKAHDDIFIYPIVVTALCSAMRLGDCCCLRWDSVDIENGFLSVKTAKTGVTVDIPIFPLLYEVLSERIDNGSEFVYPQQREQYLADQTVFTRRLRAILCQVGFFEPNGNPQRVVDDYDPAELRKKAESYIQTVRTEQKRLRMHTVLERYLQGDSLHAIVRDLELGAGTVSAYLNELQKAVGIHFIRGGKGRIREDQSSSLGRVRQERVTGLKKGSIRDWHSFRTTWITVALSSGVPFELVCKVTGHTTADVVMKHYYQPQRAALKKALQTSMPKLLTSGPGSRKDRVLELLEGATAKTWKKHIEEALSLIRESGI